MASGGGKTFPACMQLLVQKETPQMRTVIPCSQDKQQICSSVGQNWCNSHGRVHS